MTSCNARELRYDDRFKMLTALPIQEYASLRSATIASIGLTKLSGSITPTVTLGNGGRQLDISVTFALPLSSDAARVGVSILRSADGARHTDIYLSKAPAPPPPPPPRPPPPSPPPASPYMPGVDLPGGDSAPGSKYFGVNYTDPHLCRYPDYPFGLKSWGCSFYITILC